MKKLFIVTHFFSEMCRRWISVAWAASSWPPETFSILFWERQDKITPAPYAMTILAITLPVSPLHQQ